MSDALSFLHTLTYEVIQLNIQIHDVFFIRTDFAVEFSKCIFDFLPICVAFLFKTIDKLVDCCTHGLNLVTYHGLKLPEIVFLLYPTGDGFQLSANCFVELFKFVSYYLCYDRSHVCLSLRIPISSGIRLYDLALLDQFLVIIVELTVEFGYHLLSFL